MFHKDKMMKGASPLKQNQGTDVRQQKIVLASPKFFSQKTQIGTDNFFLTAKQRLQRNSVLVSPKFIATEHTDWHR